MAPPVAAAANQGDARAREPSAIYKLVMTPLLFISFVVSLALVDLRNSARRAHYHPDPDPDPDRARHHHHHHHHSRLPAWLHRIVYRYLPYDYVAVDERGRPWGGRREARRKPTPGSGEGREDADADGDGDGYYHSKQRKLMKMEAAEAFEIRGWVMAILGLLSMAVLWGLWRVVCWGLGVVRAWVS
ncbi:hypothetical protein VTK56DRAFT_10228 [Thermocarpiscus australiensis]